MSKKLLFIIPLLFILSLSFASAAVTLNTVTFTATGNNETLIGSANATEPAGSNQTFYYKVFLDNALSTSSLVTPNTQNVNKNFVNISTNGVAGTYILQVISGNATANSSAMNSSAVTVSFPASSSLSVLMRLVLTLILVVGYLYFAMTFALSGGDFKEKGTKILGGLLALIIALVFVWYLFGS